MRSGAVLIGLALAGVPAAPGFAQGAPTEVEINAAVVELQGKGADAALVCVGEPGWIVCTGVTVGVCLSAGWQVSHTGDQCRKKAG